MNMQRGSSLPRQNHLECRPFRFFEKIASIVICKRLIWKEFLLIEFVYACMTIVVQRLRFSLNLPSLLVPLPASKNL